MLTQNRLTKFLELYESKSTSRTYKTALTYFFSSIYPKEIFVKKGKQEKEKLKLRTQILATKVDEYFSEKHDIAQDIINFQNTIKERPPKTIKLFLAVVRSFLIENEIELSEKFWRRIRRRINGSKAVTKDEVPDNKKLRKILTHMATKGKALFLTLASSGMRIGETLQLELDDVDFSNSPTKIEILRNYTKGGNRRTTFISSEATEALKEWLKIREQSTETAIKRSRSKKTFTTNKNNLFPYQSTTAQFMWNEALRKSGFTKFDKETNRRTLHIHVLRKFFRTRMALVMPLDMVEALMGHEGYLTGAYRSYSDEQLSKNYLKAEHTVSIFGEIGEVSKLRKEFEENIKFFSSSINRFEDELEQSKIEIKDLKKQLKSTKGYLTAFEAIIDSGELLKFREWIERKYDIEAQENEKRENAEIIAKNSVSKKSL